MMSAVVQGLDINSNHRKSCLQLKSVSPRHLPVSDFVEKSDLSNAFCQSRNSNAFANDEPFDLWQSLFQQPQSVMCVLASNRWL